MEKKKTCSVTVSLLLCAVVFAVLTVVLVRFRALFGLYFGGYRGMDPASAVYTDLYRRLSQCIFISIGLGYAALYALTSLLLRVRKGDIFVPENIRALRWLSALCFAVGTVTFIYGHYYMPLYIIAAAACFFGVILAVIKDVFVNALRIREENDLTI